MVHSPLRECTPIADYFYNNVGKYIDSSNILIIHNIVGDYAISCGHGSDKSELCEN